MNEGRDRPFVSVKFAPVGRTHTFLLPDLDFDKLVPAIAPRPLFVIAGRRDAIFPIDGVEFIERAARQAWQQGGAPDALEFRYLDGGHDLPEGALADALAWLTRVL